jgi:hypothetical protein
MDDSINTQDPSLHRIRIKKNKNKNYSGFGKGLHTSATQ